MAPANSLVPRVLRTLAALRPNALGQPRWPRRLAILGITLAVAACSGGGGNWLLPGPKASGQIQASIIGGAADLSSTATTPLIVHNGFSMKVTESNYNGGTFTAAIVSYTAPTVESCYAVSMDPTGTIATFVLRAAPAVGAATGSVSPCAQLGNDVEGVLFQDTQGHSLEEFIQNQPATSTGAIVATVNGSPVTSTATVPFDVHGSFSVKLTEAGYSGTFVAAIMSYTAPTTESCYVISMDSTGTIATFTPRAAPATSGATTSPCAQITSDIEGVIFEDSLGGSLTEYFENQTLQVMSSIQATLSGVAITGSTPSSPTVVHGAFSVSLSEPSYAGPFTATINSYTAPTITACYTVAMDPTGRIATFTPYPAAPTGSPSSPSPCSSLNNDVEGVLFEDANGNILEDYFENKPLQTGGQIVAVLTATGTPLSTSPSAPTIVQDGFAVSLSEPGYQGTFSGSIFYYTAQTVGPCYAITMNPTGNVATFTPVSAPALSGNAVSPCSVFTPPLDTEGALFEDQLGHSLEVFVQNNG